MKKIKQKLTIIGIVAVASLVGIIKGTEARQKWVFKIKNKYDNRRQIAEQKSIARKGGVLLDDIELASYHK